MNTIKIHKEIILALCLTYLVFSFACNGDNPNAPEPGSGTEGFDVAKIARWDGSQWHSLGQGVSRSNPEDATWINDIIADEGLIYAGGIFENQNGSNSPAADDGPTGWLLVQGMETRCWNRPAPGTATQNIEWGQGSALYRQEFSGKILAIHNRHGDLWDAAKLVSMNGGGYTQGDRYVGGIVLVDVEAHTADYSGMAGQCVATNDPFRSCNGTDFNGIGRGAGGEPLSPHFVEAFGGGDVLWVGGPATIRNKDPGPNLGIPRDFVAARGFHDFFTDSRRRRR